jgi:diguanylate cyclase (GGDEF)-like protein
VEQNAVLERIAYTDPLTGLPNRAATIAHVDRMIAVHRSSTNRSFALMFVDLDRFAIVNDSLGHAVGDSVLVMVAQRICEHLPADAFFGRLGGDEFVVCAEGDEVRFAELALAIVNNVNRPIAVDGHDIVLSGSIGIVESAPSYAKADAMLRDADIAMYAAKSSGRAQFAVFNEAMHRKALHRLALEEKLRRAIRNRDFRAHYQPIVEVATGKTISVESLARWEGPDGVGVSTEEFIVAAEQTGLIATIDGIMFARACADAATLQKIAPEITFDINVSATMLARGELVEQFESMLAHFGLSASQFKLELTETAFMEHPQSGLRLLERARALGAEVLIDDFGMGYSSLSYVQRLPISGLKIDRSFVEPMTHERRSVEIVRAIVALARALGVHVTAEGVETAEQLEILRELGVQYAQGFYFSKALCFDDLVAYLQAQRAQAIAI